MSDYFEDVPVIHCQTILKGKFSEYFYEKDIASIKTKQLDFILRFGFNIIRGDILSSAKYGVWSFHHDDPLKYRGGPPGFWEIYNRDYANGVILQRLTNELDAGIVLKIGHFKTCLYSYEKNINGLYFGAKEWPLFVCKDIFNDVADYLEKKNPIQNTAPIYLPPTNKQFLVFILKIFFNKIKKLIHYFLLKETWNVGIINHPIQNCLEENYRPSIDFIKKPQSNEFFADPFGYELQGKKHLILERFDFKENIGKIDDWVHSDKNDLTEIKNVFNNYGHQSYPYIFLDNGEIFCIPETSRLKKLILYKRVNERWEQASILMDGNRCLDPTLIKLDNLYWLFYTDGDKNSDLHLCIKYAPELLGPWTDHAANPVKMDIRSSRPAGSFFWDRDELYRPSQNCSKTYGGSISINKVLALDTKKYREEVVKELMPFDKYYKHGIHTISILGDQTLVDSKRIKFKLL